MGTLIVILIVVAILWKLSTPGSIRRSQHTHHHPKPTHRPHPATHPPTPTSTDGLTGDQILLLTGWVCVGLWYATVMGGDPSCLFAPLYGMGLTLDQ